MTIQKKFSAILASTALVVTGFTPAMAAPINTGAAPATPIEMSQYVWNTDNATAEGRRGYRGYRGYRGHRGRRGHRRHRGRVSGGDVVAGILRSEEHTSELQSLTNLVCRRLLEKQNNKHL